jgi:hypothetical protein
LINPVGNLSLSIILTIITLLLLSSTFGPFSLNLKVAAASPLTAIPKAPSTSNTASNTNEIQQCVSTGIPAIGNTCPSSTDQTAASQPASPSSSSQPKPQQSMNNMTLEGFINYEDPIYGITLQRPADWLISERPNSDDNSNIVAIYPPSPSSKSSIEVHTLPTTFSDLESLRNSAIDAYKHSKNYYVIDSHTSATLAGKKAYEFVFTDKLSGKPEEVKEIGTIINGRTFFLTYWSTPEEYSVYLPTVQKIIESFNIHGGSSTSSSSSNNLPSGSNNINDNNNQEGNPLGKIPVIGKLFKDK